MAVLGGGGGGQEHDVAQNTFQQKTGGCCVFRGTSYGRSTHRQSQSPFALYVIYLNI